MRFLPALALLAAAPALAQPVPPLPDGGRGLLWTPPDSAFALAPDPCAFAHPMPTPFEGGVAPVPMPRMGLLSGPAPVPLPNLCAGGAVAQRAAPAPPVRRFSEPEGPGALRRFRHDLPAPPDLRWLRPLPPVAPPPDRR